LNGIFSFALAGGDAGGVGGFAGAGGVLAAGLATPAGAPVASLAGADPGFGFRGADDGRCVFAAGIVAKPSS